MHLPRLGLLHETWQLLQTAYRMERDQRPSGQAVTEFETAGPATEEMQLLWRDVSEAARAMAHYQKAS